jgi:coenzyme F420 hydrogenase subunit delta
MSQDILNKPIIILGCGNILFGDDGFGPKVIDYLETHYRLPETVSAQDMGTSIQEFLFDLVISPAKPKRIFIIDAISLPNRRAGELFEIEPDQFPEGKISGRPAHQFPSVGKLQALGALNEVEIRIMVVQTRELPEMVRPGLSSEVEEAIPRICDWLVREIGSGII